MDQINYQSIFSEIMTELNEIDDMGKLASYIPQLSKVDAKKFGVHLITTEDKHFFIGNSNEAFSIQSISKLFSLTAALEIEGDRLWQRVGVEPSGSAFNSLVQLEYENGIPRNPFINAGAIVICDILVSNYSKPKPTILEFIKNISGNPHLANNPTVARSEKQTGFRNNALINLMKDFGNINNDIETVLDLYFYLCSIEMSCKDLAQAVSFLASNGINPISKQIIVSQSRAKRLNSIMQLCGFYDEAGEFSFRIGLPGKSGVGGGIIAVHPGEYSIAVWSPKLNNKGNSFKGMKLLELLTTKTQSSIF